MNNSIKGDAVNVPSASLKRAVTLVRPLRLVKRNKASEYIFYLAALLTASLVVVVIFEKKWTGAAENLTIGVGAASCIGFVLEMQASVKVALASIWARVIGKAMYGVLALLA